jgi:hypothetical protein
MGIGRPGSGDSMTAAGPGTIRGDDYIRELATLLKLRTITAVGGGRYRIEGEELGTLLKIAHDAVEELYEGVLLDQDIQESSGAQELLRSWENA